MRKVAEDVEDTEDVVDEAEVDAVAEVDEEEKERRIETTAHIAEWTTIPPKTAGSVKGSKTNNNISNLVNVLETPTMTK